MSKLLTGLFKEVFGRSYAQSEPDDKINIQKNTYLLEKLGLDMGEFLFLWDLYGPYSLEVRNAVSKEETENSLDDEQIEYSSFAKERISSVKHIIQKGNLLKQTPRVWLEIVCSLHYLKNYIVADGDVISELESRKPHYSDRSITSEALNVVNIIDTMGYYDESSYQS